MKKFISIILALILSLSLVACASTDTKTDTKPDTTPSPVLLIDKSLSIDYDEKDVLVLTFEWTNLGDSNTCFTLDVQVKAFQNGVALEDAFFLPDENIPISEGITEVKPGGTLTVADAFILRDTETPVEIEVVPLFADLTSEEPYLVDTYEFN